MIMIARQEADKMKKSNEAYSQKHCDYMPNSTGDIGKIVWTINQDQSSSPHPSPPPCGPASPSSQVTFPVPSTRGPTISPAKVPRGTSASRGTPRERRRPHPAGRRDGAESEELGREEAVRFVGPARGRVRMGGVEVGGLVEGGVA
ncbi:uncharacterized protein A4U43_C02F5440 [Asparagus officinalis]|uniref:Uncharacterized protein n=1 Tax=Asparagus officinalis TaxID=4686 RepID=A0A5P1FGU7_ASPOF|nr:uncharacterized protein A4U43_C02F5440 [Asparagus officinalis]